jgi:hypothetical protein
MYIANRVVDINTREYQLSHLFFVELRCNYHYIFMAIILIFDRSRTHRIA